MKDTVVTVVGTVTVDPEIRFTDPGTAIARFRMISTPREFDRPSGQWRDSTPVTFTCTAWRVLAENVADSLRAGMEVIVHGRIQPARPGASPEGGIELSVDSVGVSLAERIVYTQASMPPGLAAAIAQQAPPTAPAPAPSKPAPVPAPRQAVPATPPVTGWDRFRAVASAAVADPSAWHIT
ncbi:single-stranded DNA-binding protein [Actinacidiphila glaucinigra]|uniref:single-stranded DNA-binding protein n=1 Tax=Actinacidiphila glaucinigra TaxID=235986 RepID=UPI0033A3681B